MSTEINNGIKKGGRVIMPKYNFEGIVDFIVNDNARVIINSTLKMIVPLNDLKQLPSAKNKVYYNTNFSLNNNSINKLNTTPCIDLHGMKVDCAIKALEKMIDNCLLSNYDLLKVIHGKGHGILRKAITNYVNKSDMLSISNNFFHNFNSGVTFVNIK